MSDDYEEIELECPAVCKEGIVGGIVGGIIGGFIILGILNALAWYILIQRRKEKKSNRRVTIPNIDMSTAIPNPYSPEIQMANETEMSNKRGMTSTQRIEVTHGEVKQKSSKNEKVTNFAKAQMNARMSARGKKKMEAVTGEMVQKSSKTEIRQNGADVKGGAVNYGFEGDTKRPSFQLGDDLEDSDSFESDDDNYEAIPEYPPPKPPVTDL